MIEFKQIIGRGTRLYDGKDYFTIYDFVKAHHHFADPGWDGEPIDPVICSQCGVNPCQCSISPPQPCVVCGQQPCRCNEPPPCKKCGKRPCECVVTKVILSDGKVRQIRHMTATSFWSADGRPMSAAQFLESLFGTLPDFFKDEDALREIWSKPETRKKLLEGLSEKGFDRSVLTHIQHVIEAEDSDLYDVLAYVAFSVEPLSRVDRAKVAKDKIHQNFDGKQQAFLDFVLSQYVKQGVDELSQEKLRGLLELKYQSIHDATMTLGNTAEIRNLFIDFQKHLYQIESVNL